jgi:uncharacterized protein YciI
MKNLLFVLVFLTTYNAIAQEKAMYDEKLAKETGADDYGMKNYIFCILKTGSNTTATKEEKQKYFEGHMANINRLAEEGKLIIAGPFMKNDRNYRGIFILNCATIQEATVLVETDPAVAAKIFEAELTPWYSSASLLLLKGQHEKLVKTKFK